MKLKYYLNGNILKIILFSMIITYLVTTHAQAYDFIGSNLTDDEIYKCQASTIYGNFSGAITSVDVKVNNTRLIMIQGVSTQVNESYTMTDNGGGHYSYEYGNDPTINWGLKEITFEVTVGANKYYNKTNLSLLVYRDDCTGANIAGYQNISRGFGNYTNRFYTGEVDFLGFALYPWLEYWGYFFYVILIFWIASLTYMKNRQIIQPIIILCISLGALVTTTWLPDDYRQTIILLLGVSLAGIFYKVFKT